MATYGDFPGVKVTTAGGGITGLGIGSEEKIVIFGLGDPASGSANTNEPTQILARSEADEKFGEGSELANAMRDALANGANISYLYGVMLNEASVVDEGLGTSATHHSEGEKISNAPIVEDTSAITFNDGTGTEQTVEFRYETNTDNTSSDFTGLSPDSGTVYVNPLTGEWVASAADDYTITYDYGEWQAGFDSLTTEIQEDETGVLVALSEAESVASSLNSTVEALRGNYKLVSGIAGAEPNATNDTDDNALINTADYTNNVDSDTQFLAGPVRQDATYETVLGGVGGLFAGNDISDPIYNDVLVGYTGLEQVLTKSEADTLRDANVIPIREAGSIRVKDNSSTSSETDWERDFWRRRIVDRAILIGKTVGDATIGRINDEDTRKAARRLIRNELEGMVNDRLIEPNEEGEENWFVEVYQDDTDPDKVNINIGITPQGVVKRVEESITIQT